MKQHSAQSRLDWTVDALIDVYPGMLPVLLRHGMACVGCPMAAFETLAEAAREYRVDPTVILQEVKGLPGGRADRKPRTTDAAAPTGAISDAGEDST